MAFFSFSSLIGHIFSITSILISFFKISDNIGEDDICEAFKISVYFLFPKAIEQKHSLALVNLVIFSSKNPSASAKSRALGLAIKLIIFSFTVFVSSIN